MSVHSDYPLATHWRHHVRRPPRATWRFPPPPCGKATQGHMKKAESVLDRPLALCGGSGAALAKPAPAKPLTASTYQPENLGLDYAPGLLPGRKRERSDRPKHHEKHSDLRGVKPLLRGLGGYTRRVRSRAPIGIKCNRERLVPLQKSATKASKRVLTLPSRLGGYCRGP